MGRFEYKIFADYFQFYFQDEAADGDLGDSWDDEAVHRLLATADGAVGVGTVRDMDVPVVVETLDFEPPLDVDNWDHVTECSLEVRSGRIVIAGCSDYFPEAARFEVRPGTYRARISYGSLGTLSEDGLDGDDRYLVQLWLGTQTDVLVRKQRRS